jgi:hypothetical protein
VQGHAGGPRPDQVTLYAGICEGGPLHGKPLYHGLPTFEVARLKAGLKSVTWFGHETDEVRLDPYVHEDGRWIWKEK